MKGSQGVLSHLGGREKERRKLFLFSKTKVRRKERRKEGGLEGERRKEGEREGSKEGGEEAREKRKKQKDWTGPEFRKQPSSRCSHPPYTP